MTDLKDVRKEYAQLLEELSDPEIIQQRDKFQELARRKSQLEKILKIAEELETVENQIEENRQILSSQEAELASLAEQEINTLQEKKKQLEEQAADLSAEKKTQSPSAFIMEIRAGTGGEEAALFAAQLFRMYSKYGERKGWKQTLLESSPTEIGGIKDIAFEIKGKDVGIILSEAGVHRVQRIPETEKSGRVHTSTATVAILSKPSKEQMQIRPEDMRMDFYRSSGAGGQNVNKRETAVRLTHIPTGIVVACQTARTQMENKEHALSLLTARILEKEEEKKSSSTGSQRNAQIGGAKRSDKIRTYNFPQDRITDHRIQKSWRGIENIMAGDLDPVISSLQEIPSISSDSEKKALRN